MRTDLRDALAKSAKLKNWRLSPPSAEELESVISVGEKIISVIQANFNLKYIGVAILTDKGLHLTGRGMIKSLSPYSETIAFRTITGVTMTRQIAYMGYTIEVSRASNVDRLIGIEKHDAEFFFESLKKLIFQSDQAPSSTISPQLDPLEQLKTLKELFDLGIITEDEFLEKKQVLMGRI